MKNDTITKAEAEFNSASRILKEFDQRLKDSEEDLSKTELHCFMHDSAAQDLRKWLEGNEIDSLAGHHRAIEFAALKKASVEDLHKALSDLQNYDLVKKALKKVIQVEREAREINDAIIREITEGIHIKETLMAYEKRIALIRSLVDEKSKIVADARQLRDKQRERVATARRQLAEATAAAAAAAKTNPSE